MRTVKICTIKMVRLSVRVRDRVMVGVGVRVKVRVRVEVGVVVPQHIGVPDFDCFSCPNFDSPEFDWFLVCPDFDCPDFNMAPLRNSIGITLIFARQATVSGLVK